MSPVKLFSVYLDKTPNGLDIIHVDNNYWHYVQLIHIPFDCNAETRNKIVNASCIEAISKFMESKPE